MTLNQIIDMILKRVMGQIIHRGINAGMNAVAASGRNGKTGRDRATPAAGQGAAGQGAAGQDDQVARRARRAARMARRMTKP